MLTTGSKLFFGAALLFIAGAVAYGGITDAELFGTIVLSSLAIASIFLGAVTLAFRDANVGAPVVVAGSVADAEGRAAPGARVSPSMWPLVGAFGVALVVIGLASDVLLALFGALVLVVTVVEWSIQGWADRASDDPAYNSALRRRVLGPIEFPVLGVLGAGVVVFGFSRLMLAITKEAALVAFIVIAVAILAGAALVAAVPRFSKDLAVILLVGGGLGMLTAGVVAVANGEREFEQHPPGEALPPGDSTNEVGGKGNVLAIFEWGGSGLTIEPQPVGDAVVVPRSLWTTILFRNEGKDPARLVIEAVNTVIGPDGKPVAQEMEFTTNFVGEGQEQTRTFRITKPGDYEYRVESESGAALATGQIKVF